MDMNKWMDSYLKDVSLLFTSIQISVLNVYSSPTRAFTSPHSNQFLFTSFIMFTFLFDLYITELLFALRKQ